MYTCSKCGIKVLILDGKVFKPCKCDAPIVANMQAKARGNGGVHKT